MHLSIHKAGELIDKFHKLYPKVRNVFHKEIREHVTKYRNLIAPNGRRRDFFGRMENSLINEAISYIPQVVVSDQNKFSFIGISEEMPEIFYLNESHDSSLVEIKKDELERYGGLVKKYIETPINFNRCSLKRDFELVIPSEIEWSDTNWAEMRKLC